ncbi:MAG: hypothetical protein GC164_13560 [Phycisphaera sp.]|nr:hypothetical protein [Phycisphaera sp.]
MSLRQLNTICYTLCIVCIVAGVVFALILIRGDIDNKIAWKGFMTIGVFFLASCLTLSVNKMMDKPTKNQA